MSFNVFGPPGSGKTRFLTALVVEACRRVGPAKVAAITYTRAAAEELRRRVALSLDIPVDDDILRRELPWVGTFHSVGARLAENARFLTANDVRTFAADNGLEFRAATPTDPTSLEEIDWLARHNRLAELDLSLRLLSAARHRCVPIEHILGCIPHEAALCVRPDRILWIVSRYAAFKKARGLVDYEDLLELSLRRELPVLAIFLDEAQDNSPLLWRLFDSWAARCLLAVPAGDPWQAIYVFMGADPEAFASRHGRWVVLGTSHRLRQDAVRYATAILRDAGWDHPLLSSWRGCGGRSQDGTRFILARTNAMVSTIRSRLLEDGEPFCHLPGRSAAPWDTTIGRAHRVAIELLSGAALPSEDLDVLFRCFKRERPASWEPDAPVSLAQVESVLGHSLAKERQRWRYAGYFDRVWRRHGAEVFSSRPATAIGTIHASKGQEADEVVLVTSWARVPAKSIAEHEGRRREACVAYVAATRHRSRLTFIESAHGVRYPFPQA